MENMARVWLQQPRFRELVDAKVAKGVPKEAQAKGIGIEVSSFTTYYSGKGREPGKKTLQLLSAYYEVPLSELTDDPGAERPGGVDLSRETPIDRYRCEQAFRILTDADLTDDERQILAEDLAASRNRLKMIKQNLR